MFFCQQGLTAQSDQGEWKIAIPLTLFVFPLLLIALLNWSVYKTAKLQANAVAIQIGSLDGCESHQHDNSRRRLKERKAALDVSIIIAAFVLCFLPTWIVNLCLWFLKSTNVPSEAVLVRYCIFMFSSVCNPIIYSIRKRDFRRAVKNLFLRRRITPQTNPSDMENRVTGMILTCSANHGTEAFTSTLTASLAT